MAEDNLENLVEEERTESAGNQAGYAGGGPSFWDKAKPYLPWIAGIAAVLVIAYLLYRNARGSGNTSSAVSTSTVGGGSESSANPGPPASSGNGSTGGNADISAALSSFEQQMQASQTQQAQEFQTIANQQNQTLTQLQSQLSQEQQAQAGQLQSAEQQQAQQSQQFQSTLEQQQQAFQQSQQDILSQLQSQIQGVKTSIAQGYSPSPKVAASSPNPAPVATPTVNRFVPQTGQEVNAQQQPNPTALPSAEQSPGFRSVENQLSPQEAAVVAGASNQPLTAAQVSDIQKAEGGTPLTDWQKQWLETGGASGVPAIPGGKGPTKYA